MSARTTCLVWAACFVAGVGSVATVRADSPVYADLNGMCGGKTPCFSTIQQAVNAASDPDGSGPLSAEVFVFPGVYFESVHIETMAAIGDIQLKTVDSAGNPSPGTAAIEPANGPAIWNAVFAFPGRVIIDGFVVTSPNAAAIDLLTSTDIVVANVLAHDAGGGVVQDPFNLVGTGIKAISSLGDVTVRDSEVRTCGATGVIAASELADVTVDSVEVRESGADGIHAESTQGAVVRDARAVKNNARGIVVTADIVSIERCRVEENFREGLHVLGGDALSVVSTTAIGNREYGIDVEAELGDVTLDGLSAEGNGLDGISAVAAGNLAVSNSSSTRSVFDGFRVIAEGTVSLDSLFSRGNRRGYMLKAPDGVHVANAAAEECEIGFVIVCDGNVNVDRLTAVDSTDGQGVFVTPTSATEFVREFSMHNSLIANNAKLAGIQLNQLAPNGSHVITGSIICGNNVGGPGLNQTPTSTAVIDARGNWWGDVTGPMLPNKPGGMGDGIEPGGGEILVDPWIDEITAIMPKPAATLADDVVVQFQFRHGGSERYLGVGPGAVGARRPFTVTTDNGTVSSHDQTAAEVSAFVKGDKGIVEVFARGAFEGVATIELSGLCFPSRSVTIPMTPAPAPEPRPDPVPEPADPTLPSDSSSPPPSASRQGAPACGAGVPAMAGLSAIGLLATRLSTRPRRSRVG